VSRAALLGLEHERQSGLSSKCAGDGVAAVAVDHVDRRRRERACGLQHVRQQRTSRDRQQHLGPGRAHALALARGQDHDVEWLVGHAGIIAAGTKVHLAIVGQGV
jgi:hypothetical protein